MKSSLTALIILAFTTPPTFAQERVSMDGSNWRPTVRPKFNIQNGFRLTASQARSLADSATISVPDVAVVTADFPLYLYLHNFENGGTGKWNALKDSPGYEVKECWYQLIGNYGDLPKFASINVKPSDDNKLVWCDWSGVDANKPRPSDVGGGHTVPVSGIIAVRIFALITKDH